jgi:hypothetical protein
MKSNANKRSANEPCREERREGRKEGRTWENLKEEELWEHKD